MKKILPVCILLFVYTSISYAQFDKPSFTLAAGLSDPYDQLAGTYYMHSTLGKTMVTTPNTELYRSNYGAKMGFHLHGKIKINFDKYNIIKAVGTGAINSFNAFEPTRSGNIGVRVVNYNNEIDTFIIPVDYNYRISAFSFGLGLELSPLSFTNIFSPYFGASMNFNLISTDLERSESSNDTTSMETDDLRIGFNFDAGLEYKVNKTLGIVAGLRYDLGNVFLKNTNSSISDVNDWGRSGGSINDDEGYFYSTIYNPVISADRYQVKSNRKNINWGTIYVGVNLYIDTTKKKPKKGTRINTMGWSRL